MKTVVIFWHNYLVNDWKDLISNQFEMLFKSGLYDTAEKICCGIVGSQQCLDEYELFIKKLVASFTTINKIETRTTTQNTFEYITINWLKEYCDSNDCYVMYFHTKGVSYTIGTIERRNCDDWRNCMTYFMIEKWKDCIAKLDEGYDCCGICFRIFRHKKYFGGNFWWANSNYVKKIEKVSTCKDIQKIRSIVIQRRTLRRNRLYYENWLWRAKEQKSFCFYDTRDFYEAKGHTPNNYRT